MYTEQTAFPDAQNLDIVTENPHALRSRRRPPAIMHFAVLTAFIVPLTILPYVVTRRQISVLRREINDKAFQNVATFQGDLKKALVEVAKAKQENSKVRALLGEVRLDIERLREEMDERQSTIAAMDDVLRSDIWKLLEERKHAR
jgi:septal ring factor EnvC (AmiA/AmiB activator)